MPSEYQYEYNPWYNLHMLSSSTDKNSKVHNLVISSESAGQRLDNFLFTYLKGVPKSRVYRIIRKGEVRINKGRIGPDYKIMAGDVLRIPPIRREEPKPILSLSRNEEIAQRILSDILYEDEGLLMLNKPSGVAVHGGSGLSFGVIEAVRYIRGSEKTLELVHRLDRDTSGCLMIAKRRSTLKAIHEQLRAGQIEKVYWALVKGSWQGGASIAQPLQKGLLSSGERFVRVSADGQPSLTEFQVLQSYKQATLMEAKPITGRTHQIRVHATSVGNPIAGDLKYGEDSFNTDMRIKGINRLFLHAKRLTLTLPDSGKSLTIEAPLSRVLQDGLHKLAEGEFSV